MGAYRALYCNVSFNKKMNTILIIGLMAVAAVASVDEFDQNTVVPEEVEVARTIGPVSHTIENSKFAKKGDHRVDDVDDTESPWACSLYNSPWPPAFQGTATKPRLLPTALRVRLVVARGSAARTRACGTLARHGNVTTSSARKTRSTLHTTLLGTSWGKRHSAGWLRRGS